MEVADFSGYATRAGLKCSDGRTITSEAFKHMDKMRVPLVWQHGHDSPTNVLGHVILEARNDGMYCHGYFNKTQHGQAAAQLVQHDDVRALSIYANQLVEKSKQVLHGIIREVSLVLSGANPGAFIDAVRIAHGDGDYTDLEDEAIISTGLPLQHAEEPDDEEDDDENEEEDEKDEVQHAADETVQDVYDSLNQKQKDVVHFMIGVALEGNSAAQSGTTPGEDAVGSTEETKAEGDLTHQEGSTVVTNVFEQNGVKAEGAKHVLSHADRQAIFADWKKGGSLKSAVEDYALAHGITDIDVLFPDAKAVADRPEFDKRRTEWVASVIKGTRKTPFSRIKSMFADLTLEEARAKGYVKGNLKKEEWFRVAKRTTSPTTVYKKQKLDRNDLLDITDFDVVAWLKMEMRLMLEEELARAILIGDGRDVDDEDKIKDPVGASTGEGVRSIANDDDLYATSVYVNLGDANSSYLELVDQIISSRRLYKGSGMPTLYTTEIVLAKFLTLRDADGRRVYRTIDELATELRVASIVPVEVLEDEPTIMGILVNLDDYVVGTDKGGEINFFDDFDLDYNQYKYLMETRMSGALVKIRAALIYRNTSSGAALVVPVSPTQDDDEVTVVTTTGVTHKIGSFTGAVTYNGSPVTVGQTITASFPVVLPDGASVVITAEPTSSSYYFDNNAEDEWTFSYDA